MVFSKPIQKILFGSPGTGKSYQIRTIAEKKLGIRFDPATKMLENTVKTVFHPEYTYADFMGKLLPLTQDSSVIYKFYPGHFLRILGMAYKNLVDGKSDNYLLVIDELNRGNAAAIFGTVFQLLDRERDGWSSYEVDISEMELVGLLEAMELQPLVTRRGVQIQDSNATLTCQNYFEKKASECKGGNPSGYRIFNLLKLRRISIPNNLSIVATINTSDESIYYLDSAFKRRWDWEYVKAPTGEFSKDDIPKKLQEVKLVSDYEDSDPWFFHGDEDEFENYWFYYIVGINEFIKSNHQTIRRIEDKQIGWWFVQPENDKSIKLEKVRDKLMFYLWDSVFARNKKPLEDLLSIELTLYSDFLAKTEKFLKEMYNLGKQQYEEAEPLPEKQHSEGPYDDIPF